MSVKTVDYYELLLDGVAEAAYIAGCRHLGRIDSWRTLSAKRKKAWRKVALAVIDKAIEGTIFGPKARKKAEREARRKERQ